MSSAFTVKLCVSMGHTHDYASVITGLKLLLFKVFTGKKQKKQKKKGKKRKKEKV